MTYLFISVWNGHFVTWKLKPTILSATCTNQDMTKHNKYRWSFCRIKVTFCHHAFTAQCLALVDHGQLTQRIKSADTCTQSNIQTDCLCCWLWSCPSVSLWPWVFLQLCDALSFCEYVQNGVCVSVRVCPLVQS